MAAIKTVALPPLVVRIVREPGLDWFTMWLPDNSSEDIEPVEALEWFRQRHVGQMDVQTIERAMDDAWNFGEANVVIVNPRAIKADTSRTTPNI